MPTIPSVPPGGYAYTPPDWFFTPGEPPSGATYFDVTDYGAVPDPNVDSTEAIQNAINAAYEAGGGVVYLPPGVYGVSLSDFMPGKSGSLFLRDNVYLKGAGTEYAGGLSSSVRVIDGSSDIITGIIRTNPSQGTSNYGVADLTIDGNRANTTGEVIGVLTGVKEENGNGIPDADATFLRLDIKNNSGYGFDPHEITVRLVIEDSVSHGNGKDGFVADYLIDSVFRNNIAFDNDRHGFNLQTSTYNFLLADNIAYGNGGGGVVVQRGNFDIPIVHNVLITGGEYYDNAKEGILVRLSENVEIVGVNVHDNGTYGIRVKGSSYVSIVDSIIANSSQASSGSYSNIQIIEEYDPITNTTFSSYYTLIEGNTIVADSPLAIPKFAVEERAGFVDYTTVAASNSIIYATLNDPISLVGAHSISEWTSATENGDVFVGDSRNDYYDGLGGDDQISGTSGNDTLIGGAGNDTVDGGTGDDALFGGLDNDTVKGGDGNDLMDGGDGDDTLLGGKGDDILAGGAGNDTVKGDSGNDWIFADAGNDAIFGGDGIDAFDFSFSSAAVTIDASAKTAVGSATGSDTFETIEKFIGSDWDDIFSGSSGADNFSGGGGNDLIRGKAGSDTLAGGAGSDTFQWFKPDVFSGTTSVGNDVIADFSFDDFLNVHELLKGQSYTNLNQVIAIADGTAGSQVSVKAGSQFYDVALLQDVHGVTVDQLLNEGVWIV
jgi:parallel beta-helix repeat protein